MTLHLGSPPGRWTASPSAGAITWKPMGRPAGVEARQAPRWRGGPARLEGCCRCRSGTWRADPEVRRRAANAMVGVVGETRTSNRSVGPGEVVLDEQARPSAPDRRRRRSTRRTASRCRGGPSWSPRARTPPPWSAPSIPRWWRLRHGARIGSHRSGPGSTRLGRGDEVVDAHRRCRRWGARPPRSPPPS